MAYRGNPAMPRARRRSPRPPCPPHAPPLGWGAFRPAHGLCRGRSHGLNGLIWRFKALSAPFRLRCGTPLQAGRETSVFLILGAFPPNARGGRSLGRLRKGSAVGVARLRREKSPFTHRATAWRKPRRKYPTAYHPPPPAAPFAPPLHPLRLLDRTSPLHAAPQPPSTPSEGKPRRRPDGKRLAVFLL